MKYYAISTPNNSDYFKFINMLKNNRNLKNLYENKDRIFWNIETNLENLAEEPEVFIYEDDLVL